MSVRLTESRLRQIIREEASNVIRPRRARRIREGVEFHGDSSVDSLVNGIYATLKMFADQHESENDKVATFAEVIDTDSNLEDAGYGEQIKSMIRDAVEQFKREFKGQIGDSSEM